jgi:hypothetical protein
MKSLRRSLFGSDDSVPYRFAHLGRCPKCDQGQLGVRICASQHPPIILCEECESAWCEPDWKQPAMHTKQPESRCPICEQPIFGPATRWATASEIMQLGWKPVNCGPEPKVGVEPGSHGESTGGDDGN